MASPNIIMLTDASFEREVLAADLPVLVDFWAVWCGPCRQIAPTVDRLAEDYAGKLKVAKLDIEHNQITPQQFGVRSIPTMLIFKSGKVVGQIIGAQPSARIKAEVKRHI